MQRQTVTITLYTKALSDNTHQIATHDNTNNTSNRSYVQYASRWPVAFKTLLFISAKVGRWLRDRVVVVDQEATEYTPIADLLHNAAVAYLKGVTFDLRWKTFNVKWWGPAVFVSTVFLCASFSYDKVTTYTTIYTLFLFIKIKIFTWFCRTLNKLTLSTVITWKVLLILA